MRANKALPCLTARKGHDSTKNSEGSESSNTSLVRITPFGAFRTLKALNGLKDSFRDTDIAEDLMSANTALQHFKCLESFKRPKRFQGRKSVIRVNKALQPSKTLKTLEALRAPWAQIMLCSALGTWRAS